MPDKKLSPLEELGQLINEAVENSKNGELRGEVYFIEHSDKNKVNHYPITRVYDFSDKLNKIVEEPGEYESLSDLREKAMDDCLISLRKVFFLEYDFSFDFTSERNKREVIIKKPKEGYGGIPILPSGIRRH